MTDMMVRPAGGRYGAAFNTAALDELQHRILAFETENTIAGGEKNGRIVSEFKMSVRQYLHVLERTIEMPIALEEYPEAVTRLLREPRLHSTETLWRRVN